MNTPILIDLPSTGQRLAIARAAGWKNWEDHVATWRATLPAQKKHSQPKKSAPTGVIPPGPWYRVAWLLLSDDERHRLTHRSRSGKVLPPTTENSPVQALSAPSKMPGYSWAITAGRTCPGAVYGEGAICSACYAGGADHGNTANANNKTRGYISRTAVRRALLVREHFTRILCTTPAGRVTFADHMAAWIARNTDPADPYFRIHDSGDFWGPSYIDAWASIIARCPTITFWAPTRSWHIALSKGGRWADSFAALNALPNATIRPSALFIGDDAPQIDGFAAGSGVKTTDWNCPASTTHNECRSCRACWDTETAIYYHAH